MNVMGAVNLALSLTAFVVGVGGMVWLIRTRQHPPTPTHLRRMGRLELGAGLTSTVLGLVGLLFVLFGPPHSTTTGATTLAQRGLSPAAWVLVGLLGVSLVGVALGAYLHSQQAARAGLWLLYAAFFTGMLGSNVLGWTAGYGEATMPYLSPAGPPAIIAGVAGIRLDAWHRAEQA
jgi:hypothetical protein